MRKIFYKIPKLGKIAKQRDIALNEVRRLKLEKNKGVKREEKDTRFGDIFLSPWTDRWKEFNLKNSSEVDRYLSRLKAGMDGKSKLVVDSLWEKIIFLIPYNRYKKSFLYKIDDFFTKEELREQTRKVYLRDYKFPKDVNIETSIFSKRNGLVFLPKEVVSRIKGSVIIDGGAYFGDSALIFAEYFPSKIYAFEPVQSTFQKLKETIKKNSLGEVVIPVCCGLGENRNKALIYGENSGASLSVIDKKNASRQRVSIVKLDDFFKNRKGKIGAIKLDIEGCELAAIKGALNIIKEHKPILLISIYHRPEDFFFIKPLIDDLNVGYKFLVRKTSPFRVTSETVLIGYVK